MEETEYMVQIKTEDELEIYDDRTAIQEDNILDGEPPSESNYSYASEPEIHIKTENTEKTEDMCGDQETLSEMNEKNPVESYQESHCDSGTYILHT